MDTSSLSLLDQHGRELSKVVDFVQNDPKVDGGREIRDISLTIPWDNGAIIALGTMRGKMLQVFDERKKETICKFLHRQHEVRAQPEPFVIVKGRIYLG